MIPQVSETQSTGHVLSLDIDKLCENYYDDPKHIALTVQKFYQEDQFESTLSLIAALKADGAEWCIFEGLCNPKLHTFKVVAHIAVYPANRQNPHRPPTQVLNCLAGLAEVRKLPIWII